MSASPALHVRYRSIAELKPRAQQPRTHSAAQVRQIAESIRIFGFNNPVLVDGDGAIIAGHGRVEAAKLLGMERVPTVRLDHMTETQIRAYVLADNRLAENAKWDRNLLAIELRYLTEIDLDFELTVTGFQSVEIDLLLQESAGQTDDAAADALPPIDPRQSPISRPGDLWILGRHRLLCADARDDGAYRILLNTKRAAIVFTDPPYNLPIGGHVSGLGKVTHAEFAMASGEMNEAEFTAFLQTVFRNLSDHSTDGSIHYLCMDWRHLYEALSAGRQTYAEFKNLCVWNKTNAGMGSLYRSKHELVLVFKNGTAAHVNNIELGRHGRYRSNVWDHAGANSFGVEREEALAMHPTTKPVALVADALLDCSRRGAIVLDPFVGSGTTIIAAERTGRAAYTIEIDPLHVDTAIRRYEAYTGDLAVHAQTGRTYRAMTDLRSALAGQAAAKPPIALRPKTVKSHRPKQSRRPEAGRRVEVSTSPSPIAVTNGLPTGRMKRARRPSSSAARAKRWKVDHA